MAAPSAELVERRVKRTFVGEGETMPWSKGLLIRLQRSRAEEYDAKGYTEAPPKAPTKAEAAAALAADAAAKEAAAKGAKPGETKESTGKDASGLEPWDGTMSEESYVAKYDGSDSPAVVEKLKLAKARIRAKVSQGANA